MLIFLKNTTKYGKRLRKKWEYVLKENHHFVIISHIQQKKKKTVSSYSEDYQDIKIPRKEILLKFSSIAILHSYFDNDSDLDFDSDFKE